MIAGGQANHQLGVGWVIVAVIVECDGVWGFGWAARSPNAAAGGRCWFLWSGGCSRGAENANQKGWVADVVGDSQLGLGHWLENLIYLGNGCVEPSHRMA